ncbi:cobalt-precorrin-6A reductase [Thiorhodovibrio frisius]|uniref:Precorrin-6x reductase n=1 Tax=Thiorhodovibrio frisius TaxID=631362 RepID=H8Z039_9GAMM|nr:cobalt-precorrin-6A reductase [Thiorhodovibrio frisius]EIC21212.1 precorrin-6x reductase [Thiorhodovibrio frisius]WPL23788.1 Precorrin-6A reductase [Thiorhodovibrio frisius]
MKTKKILILGGVTEGYILAEELASREPFHPISSLAGRTQHPRPPVGETRIGGFGGVEGLHAFLLERAIDAVVDATHPFADTMGQHAALACDQAKVPLLRLERPAWMPQPGDCWHPVADWEQAVAFLQIQGARRVLLALGARELAPFSTLFDTWFLLRTVTQPDPMPPFTAAELLVARGPFTLEQELELLRRHEIDTIVCRNSGGEGAAAKLAAARELGIAVIMRERPQRPSLPSVATVAGALDWLCDQPG